MAEVYTKLHATTKAVIPQSHVLKPTTIWVAVLEVNIRPAEATCEDDFLWVKSGQKTKASGILRTYQQSCRAELGEKEEVVIACRGEVIYPNPAGNDPTIKSFLNDGEQLVVLEAIRAKDVLVRLASNLSSRQPLKEISASNTTPKVGRDAKGRFHTPSLPHPTKTEGKNNENAYFRDSSTPLSSTHTTSPSLSELDRRHQDLAARLYATQPSSRVSVEAGSQEAREAGPSSHVRESSTSSSSSDSESEVNRTSPATLRVAFTSEKAPKNLPFLHYRKWFGEHDPTARHFSPSYTHDMAWNLWLQMNNKDRHPFFKSAHAESEAQAQDKPEGWFANAFTFEGKPEGPEQEEPEAETQIKHEMDFESQFKQDQDTQDAVEPPKAHFQLQDLLVDAELGTLEKCVERGVKYLDELKRPVKDVERSNDAKTWLTQIEKLAASAVKTRTIIGVVGNTGAGKSSVINAMLDEERLVPTNTMRACTAVVTELSYNYIDSHYRAEIEFITPADWLKELEILYDDLIDADNKVSKDSSNEDTDAGVAYAKIKAVYPKLTKDDMAQSSPAKLIKEVEHFLGTTRKINEADSLFFYRQLQRYVDSKEKNTGKKDKEDKKPREREFWPLIKVVRIYVRSAALETGAVIVDLPGVHDANAARAAVAEGYIKQCTGLWIVAPIIRAVDDKAAKKLMGESFKRQLKMDGGYNSVTFICSKTDDISLTEASDSLGLNEQNAPLWEESDELENKIKKFKNDIDDIKDTQAAFDDAAQNADDELDVWEDLKSRLEDGNKVYAPVKTESKKRKRSTSSSSNKKKRSKRSTDSDDDFIDDDEDLDRESQAVEDEEDDDDLDDMSARSREPLTEEQIDDKLRELKSIKKESRNQKRELEEKIKGVRKNIKEAVAKQSKIESEISRACIEGRNQYSKGAIQQDFASGIKELDQEIAEEDYEENFNPDVDVRDYDEVARSLPVFCVSSRGYQKLMGRLQRDKPVSGFTSAEQTDIPALQAHCKQLTVAGRTAACKRFMTNLSSLLNSLTLWASNDGTGSNMTEDQRRKETKFLNKSLENLENCLVRLVDATKKNLTNEYSDNIFNRFTAAVESARQEAEKTSSKWGAPLNRADRSVGGLYWATYKAVCRRVGVYTSGTVGALDFNAELCDPIMKQIASGWERNFTRRSPLVMANFSKSASKLLQTFHNDVANRASMSGMGLAGLPMLQSQLVNYEEKFKNTGSEIKDNMNKSQKDINREFTPIISEAMVPSYEACVAERGTGSFARMKSHMNNHVHVRKDSMFKAACDEVKKQLVRVLRTAEETMEAAADEVYISMSRDYRSVVGGEDVIEGEQMPKWQRDMRKDMMGLVLKAEGTFRRACGLEPEIEEKEEEVKEEKADQEGSGDKEPSSDALEDPLADKAAGTTEEEKLVKEEPSDGKRVEHPEGNEGVRTSSPAAATSDDAVMADAD